MADHFLHGVEVVEIDNGPRLKALEKRLLVIAGGGSERAETTEAAQ